jgi:hypothetical protein
MEENKTNENALNKNDNSKISKDFEIGIHQGSINTLLAERNELIKMIQNVEQIIEIHINDLKS